MAEERDRTKRYSNPPKSKKSGGMQNKEESGAKAEAEKTAGGKDAPHADAPGKVGKEGSDKGPEGSPSPEFGVIAERHKGEHGQMIKRHSDAMAAMHETHGKEAKDMMSRHSKEMQNHMEEGAAGKAEATAGKPKELGKEKDEGKKGSSV